MFTTVGNVESATVMTSPETGLSLGYGYVEMATPEEAMDCIERFHGFEKDGLRLAVTKDIPHVPTARVIKNRPKKIAFAKKRQKPSPGRML
jgi:RNA recognition motif-containing protein